MLKWLALFLIAFSCLFLSLKPKYSRNIIDLASLNQQEQGYLASFERKIDYSGFNSVPEIGDVIQSLAIEFEIEQAIEIMKENLEQVQSILQDKENIHFHLGSSEVILQNILPKLVESALYST